MRVAEYIITIPHIFVNSSREECIQIMLDNSCNELPVHHNGKLYGTVYLKGCLRSKVDIIEPLIEPSYACVGGNSHLFDVLRILKEQSASVCSVTNEKLEWLGIITKDQVISALAESITIEQSGAILIVEMAAHHYSSNEIARIIEGEGAKILGFWLTSIPNSSRIQANIKLNVQNVERISRGLQRYGYDAITAFGDDDYSENVEQRFQSLMKYIDF